MKVPLLIVVGLLSLARINNGCPEECKLPDCSCFSTTSPIQGDDQKTPQMVVISFDDAVTEQNMPLYEYLSEFTNPNGCPISMTFFVSHEYSEYDKIHELHRIGHEIAVHSVTHKPDVSNYWETGDYNLWSSEMNDARDMIVKYGRIPKEDITGWRSPFLVVGGDIMYQALVDSGFKYDCSWPTLRYTDWYPGPGDEDPLGAVFPYTMDYATPIDDPTTGERPEKTYEGFWNVPMVDLKDDRGIPCAMLDACQGQLFNCSNPECEDAVFDFLKANFDRNYIGSRSPFGLYAHESWFRTDAGETHLNAYVRFMDYLAALNDVWVVSIDRLLAWMKAPVSEDEIYNFEPFDCKNLPSKSLCTDSETCKYDFNDQKRTLHICGKECPPAYPWLGNVNGTLTPYKSKNNN